MPGRIDEKLKAKGFDPDQVRQQIRGHLQGTFGGDLQGYADAIRSKPPEQLSDPQSAAALRAISPALFGEGVGADPQRPGVMSFNFGTGAPVPQDSGMHPSAMSAINSILQHQQANPVTLPIAPGTKMRWQVNDEEARRAQAAAEAMRQEQFDYGRERDAIADERWQMQWDADQAYRNAQLALQRAAAARSAAGGGAAGTIPGGYEDRTATMTERDRIPLSDAGRSMIEDIRSNPDINLGQWKAAIQGDSEIRSNLMRQGIDVNDFLDFVDEQYTLYHLQEAMSRVGQNVTPWAYGKDLRDRQDLIRKYNPWETPKAPAEELTADQEAAQWWSNLGPQGQQDIKNQLVSYSYNEIDAGNIHLLTPTQILEQWNRMLGGR